MGRIGIGEGAARVCEAAEAIEAEPRNPGWETAE